MDSTQISDLVEKQDWLQGASDVLQKTGQAVLEPAGPAIRDILHGVWLGHPLHPVLTDVPLGAWTAAAVLDIMEATGTSEVGPGADAAVGVGIVGALGAAASGLADWYQLGEKRPQRIGAAHALLNTSALTLYAMSWALRRQGARGWGRALGWLGFGVVCASAYLGGQLVSEEKLGVNHAEEPGSLPKKFTAVLADSELGEGQMRRVEADGAKIVLARKNGQVYALSEICSHLGGPLAEGKIVENCVECPWHGSQFDLATGQVVHGPATFPVPALGTRVRSGQVEVRLQA